MFIDNIKLPYSIEVWKSKIPINIIRNGGNISLYSDKAYLKINNVYVAEVIFLNKYEIQVCRFIEEEENKNLLERCDKFTEVYNE
jgi:hypothetical protein